MVGHSHRCHATQLLSDSSHCVASSRTVSVTASSNSRVLFGLFYLSSKNFIIGVIGFPSEKCNLHLII
ncbi:hypothetical protein L1887_20297 [Cichorium endivia]|nr:hypothetical protein L1887_20297 [Cichorium endivia]